MTALFFKNPSIKMQVFGTLQEIGMYFTKLINIIYLYAKFSITFVTSDNLKANDKVLAYIYIFLKQII